MNPPGGPPGYPPGYPPPPPGGFDAPPAPPGGYPGYPPQPPVFGPPTFGDGGYPQQGPGAPTEQLAIVSLVMGIISLPMACCCSFIAMAGSIAAIVCGIIALGKIDKSQGTLGGRGLAIAGIVVGAFAALGGLAQIVFQIGNLAWNLSGHGPGSTPGWPFK